MMFIKVTILENTGEDCFFCLKKTSVRGFFTSIFLLFFPFSPPLFMVTMRLVFIEGKGHHMVIYHGCSLFLTPISH
jgi:hypothetical protein